MQQGFTNATPITNADELQSALAINPAKLQAFMNDFMLGRGRHSKARAQRGMARVAKRKAKRKA